MPHEKTNGENKALHTDIRTGRIEQHLEHINHELRQGFTLLKKYPKSVTILGSSQTPSSHPSYVRARELAYRIADELKYAVITGGGPGIMEAANKGAKEAKGDSAGLSISLPHEHMANGFTDTHMKFSYFFTRKAMLTFAAEAYVFFPGGFGTFDELFSILTLIQTGKIPRVPVLMYDSSFWNTFESFLKEVMLKSYGCIDESDLKLFEITDSLDIILDRIRRAPVSEWWRNIN